VIEPTAARTIRQIFQLCAEGHGYSAIAAVLNASGIATARGASSWCASSVRAVLHNENYRGVIV
jgi:hypothetical protein